jgi:signal transduction histidine kinase/CheY-like chemotaxis protein/HAMP domain-containing protein
MDFRALRLARAGRWRDTRTLRELDRVIRAALHGDFTVRVADRAGSAELQPVVRGVHQLLDENHRFLAELGRLRRVIGQDGRMTERARIEGDERAWESGRVAVNDLVDDLVRPTSEIARVITAVAQGDLSQKITVDAKGEVLELKRTLNTMVDQLSAFADEVTRVAGEVGTEGKLGGQARVPGVSGIWADLTDNVNQLADNLTNQVRNIAEVTTAVARGDLSRKITVDASGEILELKSTINTMVDQLSAFADEVTRVAGEVGTEGKLGGQARVPGVSGIWADLTDNVNQLAANLTTQVRAIAEVSTAVTTGDLTRSISVEAQGEVAELKDNINQMIANLRETTLRNAEQDWLKTNLARIGTLLQGQRDLQTVADLIMSELTPVVSAQYGSFYLAGSSEDGEWSAGESLRLVATYGHRPAPDQPTTLAFGEGLAGQAARDRRPIQVDHVPVDTTVRSGLGQHALVDFITLPILFEGDVLGVIELGSLQAFPAIHKEFLGEMVETIGVVLNTIQANMRTEELLDGSRSLTKELQSRSRDLQLRQDELRRTNEELEEKATLLEEQKRSVERKNLEIEEARRSLQEKAEQLALSSKYKSQFLANMSHELRTPMNSMLLMAEVLAEDPDSRMTPQQVEFAKLIRSSGNDLLDLIDDILDLSKIEAGRIEIDTAPVPIENLVEFAQSVFRPGADKKGLRFHVEVEPGTPEAVVTDERRLQQILKNLLANAIKFTAEGTVSLRVAPADRPMDEQDTPAVAFHVTDTGIGIPEDKLHLIFEAFQQADGSTNRQFGGTGLGLSISTELARLLDGEILVESTEGSGSTFTVVLPHRPVGGIRDHGRDDDELAGASPEPHGHLDTGLAGPDGEKATLQGRRIMLVDDDHRNAYALQQVLDSHGVDVVTAEDGRAALALLDAHPDVDAVLMDIMMPVLDGLEATRLIRKDDRFADLPIIMLTAKAMPDDREQSLAAGATDFVTKPFESAGLLDLLRTRIAGKEAS